MSLNDPISNSGETPRPTSPNVAATDEVSLHGSVPHCSLPEIEAILPTWIESRSILERETLKKELALIQTIDARIITFESQYHLLEKFLPVRDWLEKTCPTPSPQPAMVYGELAKQYCMIATYGAQYHQLIAENLLAPERIESLLDFGPGYWNSSSVYELLFPNLSFALGIEGDSEKVSTFESIRDSLLNPSRQVFHMQEGDFFETSKSRAQNAFSIGSNSSQQTDLVLMQTFYPMVAREMSFYGYSAPDPKERSDYTDLLKSVGTLLTPDGKFVFSVDNKDLSQTATHLPWFCETLESLGAVTTNDFRLGIHPIWQTLCRLDVTFFILPKELLESV